MSSIKNMAHIGWGHLKDSEGYGKLGDSINDYRAVTKEELSTLESSTINLKHAAHGMIFAKKSNLLWNLYDQKGLVMMQVRFDGLLGFPGGLVDDGEKAVDGINREMHEEIGLDLHKYSFTEDHHIACYYQEMKKMILHFYLMEVSPEDFATLEQKTLSAEEYGIETCGIVRVPLFTMGDGVRGFPAFLANQFAGNARAELIHGLLEAKLFSESEMGTALKAYKDYAESIKSKTHL
uniref:U8 snoRNA-decapping enzyme n=1 Tax=Biomphalaria glabrata TaxID=6526 RepID=A0A2C9KL81_BIOGL